MRVLLDVDGVLCDFVGPYLNTVNEACGTSFVREDVNQYDIGAALKAKGFTGDLEYVEREFLRQPGWCYGLPSLLGAISGVADLRQLAGVDVYAVTAGMDASPYWMYERKKWLVRYFGFTEKQIVFTHAKYLVSGDFFVDDKFEHVSEWADHHDGEAILWDAGYNHHQEWSPRIESWDELVQLVWEVDQSRLLL